MTACAFCIPWTLPFQFRRGVNEPAMSYADGLLYHLHVARHQANNWTGEIEAVSDLLRLHPDMTLVPLLQAA